MKEAPLKVIVIGGGASGMTAAITAARNGAEVVVVERMSRVGKKLLATGNGRCNLSNVNLSIDRYHGQNPRFAEEALRRFGLECTLRFFEELGIETREEDEGRIFPITGQASNVLDVLRFEMERLGVKEVCDTRIGAATKVKQGFVCAGTDGLEFPCDRVILATGGKSSPNLGSNGGGYKIAESFGHKIVEPFPALVQVRLDARFLKRLQGLRLEGSAEVLVDGKPEGRASGELLFADYGISGNTILRLSRIVSEQVEKGREIILRLDFFPDVSEPELAARIRKRIAARPEKTVEFSFVGLIHKRLIPVIIEEAGIREREGVCGDLSDDDARRIAAKMKGMEVHAVGTRSWMESQVTAGGVSTEDVNPKTMESSLVPGLYFSGEVLDIDGDSGGYNLQWAWSTGHVAGTECIRP